MLSVVMGLAATASMLTLLYLQRPFIAARGGFAPDVQNALFAAAIAVGGLAGLGGPVLGVAWSRRVLAIRERTEAAVPPADGTPDARASARPGAAHPAVRGPPPPSDRFLASSA